MGAALAGMLVASPIVYNNSQKRQEGKLRLEEEIERMKVLGEISGKEAFSKYFGISHHELIEKYKSQLKSSQKTLQTDIRNEGVKNAFSEFIKVGDKLVDSLENIFGNGVPKDIGEAIKSNMIAENLKDKSVSEHRAVYTGLGITGLAVAGTIAGTLVPLEIANEYFANKVEKDKN